eukprot:TRINITY_DN21138_c0_g1_i2.p1 TRINITY_DN21138_c0_g1~~TRINITY_DN21138_c0_g1_i2.p1  ORF type:complete len:455 (+),score=50.60 TRINITY_DN21138_c0_g1_i2:550-1914(+)
MVSKRARMIVEEILSAWDKDIGDSYERRPIFIKPKKPIKEKRRDWKKVANTPKAIYEELQRLERLKLLRGIDLCAGAMKVFQHHVKGQEVAKIISLIKSRMQTSELTDSDRVKLYVAGLHANHGNALFSDCLRDPTQLPPDAFTLLCGHVSCSPQLFGNLTNKCFTFYKSSLSSEQILDLFVSAYKVRIRNFPLEKYLTTISREGLLDVPDGLLGCGLRSLSKLARNSRTDVSKVLTCFTERLAVKWVKSRVDVINVIEGLVHCKAPVKGILEHALHTLDMSDATPTDVVAVTVSYTKGRYVPDLLWQKLDFDNAKLEGFSANQISALASAFSSASYNHGIGILDQSIVKGVIKHPDNVSSIAAAQVVTGKFIGSAASMSLDFPGISPRHLSDLITASHRCRCLRVLKRSEAYFQKHPQKLSCFNEIDLRSVTPAFTNDPLKSLIRKLMKTARR